jgi:hypothetical protein
VNRWDTRSGRVVWEVDLGWQYQIAVLSSRGSPLVDGSLLIVFTGAKPGACVTEAGDEMDQSIIGNVYAVLRERAECLEERRQITDETRILDPSAHGRSWVNEPPAPAHAGSRSLSPDGPALWEP